MELSLQLIQSKLIDPNQINCCPGKRENVAAVLVPLILMENDWYLVFTERTSNVQHHKNQVSFPGGSMEGGDQSVVATALREAWEEIGLKPANVLVLGCLSVLESISGYRIYPVVGYITHEEGYHLEHAEVSELFKVPWKWLADPHNSYEKEWARQGGRTEMVKFFQEYENHVIWGITAQITLDFVNLFKMKLGR